MHIRISILRQGIRRPAGKDHHVSHELSVSKTSISSHFPAKKGSGLSAMDCVHDHAEDKKSPGSDIAEAYKSAAKAAANNKSPNVDPVETFSGQLILSERLPSISNGSPELARLQQGIKIVSVFGALVALGVILGMSWFAWTEWMRRRRGVRDVRGMTPPPKIFDDTFERAFGDEGSRTSLSEKELLEEEMLETRFGQ